MSTNIEMQNAIQKKETTMVLTLNECKDSAKELADKKKISYNKALQLVANKSGYKTYEALIQAIKQKYIQDENDDFSDFKSNIFENRRHLHSNFKKLTNLDKIYDEVRRSDLYDDSSREEKLESIIEKADDIMSQSASMILGNSWNKGVDNQLLPLESAAFSVYISSDERTFRNDIDAHNADYMIELNVLTESFLLYYRSFNMVEYDDNLAYKDWLDWEEHPIIYLP